VLAVGGRVLRAASRLLDDRETGGKVYERLKRVEMIGSISSPLWKVKIESNRLTQLYQFAKWVEKIFGKGSRLCFQCRKLNRKLGIRRQIIGGYSEVDFLFTKRSTLLGTEILTYSKLKASSHVMAS